MIRRLRELNILTYKSIFHLIGALRTNGVNQSSVVSYSALRFPKAVALKFKDEEYTYEQLSNKINEYAFYAQVNAQVRKGSKVALLSNNSTSFVVVFFALSAIGADIFLLNSEWTEEQISETIDELRFDFVFCSIEFLQKVNSKMGVEIIEININFTSKADQKPVFYPSGKLIVLSSGTSGKIKMAERKASLHKYVFPFFSLIEKLPISQQDTIMITTPLFHGFGIASLIMSFFLGVKVCIHDSYAHLDLAQIIEQEKVTVVSLVPITLQRLLLHSSAKLSSLKCVLSGGAPLLESQVALSQKVIGPKLYNLYGTSEAGFTVLATPADLQIYPETIGKELRGVKVKINSPKFGELSFKSSWSRLNKKQNWVKSGDIGYRNEDGYLFVSGRVDDMIVSGGQNVYPFDLEKALLRHEGVEQAYVFGVKDEQFGQRLKAKVVAKKDVNINEAILFDFLNGKIARYHKPVSIELVDEIKVGPLGKIIKEKFPLS